MPDRARFGLTLPNRGVVTGMTTVGEMLALARQADAEPAWDSVWVGDSILAKPRLDAIALLAAIAGQTERVKLGPACMASTPLRHALLLAYQWCSLDLLANGRTIFVACQGAPGESGGDFAGEFAAFGVEPRQRTRRMEEAIEILRLTSAQENVSYHGRHYQFENVTILPRPVQQPIPIWVTANPSVNVVDDPRRAERALRRVARMGDGWMTTADTREVFSHNLAEIRRFAAEEGRDLGPESDFEVCVYHNINVNEDREAAYQDAKRFLDRYYETDFPRPFLENWVTHGSPAECIADLRAWIAAGATTITLRLTGADQQHQFERVTREVVALLLLE
jgi:alkanesulfonate monooxygenase SsuD/methylene tetrahydromethanopterin reductase-like flavin-dependent oxidoreductase (luciferase family)